MTSRILGPTPGAAVTLYPIDEFGSLNGGLPSSTMDGAQHKIDEMNPSGKTKCQSAIARAWDALTSSAPFMKQLAPAPDLDKVIIILTDGINTESRKNQTEKPYSSTAIDARTALLAPTSRQRTSRSMRSADPRKRHPAAKPRHNPTMFFDAESASPTQQRVQCLAENFADLRIER